MISQTPPRTHKEALQDMGNTLNDLNGLVRMLTQELAAIAMAALPDDRDRAQLVAACNKEPFSDAMADDYGLTRNFDDHSAVPVLARLLSDAIGSAADIAREVKELKALRREPFGRAGEAVSVSSPALKRTRAKALES